MDWNSNYAAFSQQVMPREPGGTQGLVVLTGARCLRTPELHDASQP
jgi:hypothetical protein